MSHLSNARINGSRQLIVGTIGLRLLAVICLTAPALGGPLAAFKFETPCDFAISAAHGPAGPAADAHAVAGLPAAFWTHAPFNCNYVPGPPNGVGVGQRTQHIVPTCHPGLDAPIGGLWSPSLSIAAPPVGGGLVAAAGGATRGHAPHADVFAATLTVAYNAAGAVTGYTYTSTGKHDPANCMAACAAGSSLQTVPPAVSNAFASISFVIDGATLDYSISIAARGVTQANLIGAAIHVGAPGQIGPMIIDLGPGAQWQDMQGIGISRMITGAPFPAQYLSALQQGQTYVNLRTMAFPQGEVRGQLTVPPMQTMADMNCDGLVNGKDVEAFVLAVLSPADYATRYHGCDINNGDLNGDGRVDEADLAEFVNALLA
ncbi:MAG: CHRD domain-containing protein [Planctomycetes bacterium]|nr:CHRD domain-containing protein [Planctomycetota bacterium]